MRRRDLLERQYGRALRAGLVISVAAHAAALGLRFGGGDDGGADRALSPEPAALAEQVEPQRPEVDRNVLQIVALREVQTEIAAPTVIAAQSSAAPETFIELETGAPAPVEEIAPAAAPAAEVIAVDDAPPLPSLDARAALPMAELAQSEAAVAIAAEVEAEAEEADAAPAEGGTGAAVAVPLHTPGSVATAKGQWIGGTQPARGGGKGGIGISVGSDCGDKGRGPPLMPPPISRQASYGHSLPPGPVATRYCG